MVSRSIVLISRCYEKSFEKQLEISGFYFLQNRPYSVHDANTNTAQFSDDIDDMPTYNGTNVNINNNYGYTEIGELLRDNADVLALNACPKQAFRDSHPVKHETGGYRTNRMACR